MRYATLYLFHIFLGIFAAILVLNIAEVYDEMDKSSEKQCCCNLDIAYKYFVSPKEYAGSPYRENAFCLGENRQVGFQLYARYVLEKLNMNSTDLKFTIYTLLSGNDFCDTLKKDRNSDLPISKCYTFYVPFGMVA